MNLQTIANKRFILALGRLAVNILQPGSWGDFTPFVQVATREPKRQSHFLCFPLATRTIPYLGDRFSCLW